jgi:hypothetical protein
MLNVCMVGHGMMGIWHSEALRNLEEARLHTVVGRPKKPDAATATPTAGRKPALLTFLWVPFHDRPGSGGQRPPRVRLAMAISASGLW